MLADEVCSDNNDVITPPYAQTGIPVHDSGWANSSRTFTLSATGGYTFPIGQQSVFTFTDDGPCVIEGLTAPTQAGVCGINNDVITVPEAPDHVTMTNSGAWSANSTWTVTYTPDQHYRLPDGFQAEYIFTDPGDCVIETPLNPPTSSAVCGSNNDEITLADAQPEGVNPLPVVTGWASNQITVTYSVLEHYVFGENTQHVFILTHDVIPCLAEAPISPVHTPVCGSNNDELSFLDQPTGVNSEFIDTEWENGSRTVTYVPTTDYVFPEGETGIIAYTDEGPCETDDPIPPTLTEVCGPNNDLVLVEDQPANVLVTQNEEWSDNSTWTVTFTAEEHHVLPADTRRKMSSPMRRFLAQPTFLQFRYTLSAQTTISSRFRKINLRGYTSNPMGHGRTIPGP